jgi:alpha-galactosidase/6-phospho-beta-glucosidase family protein
VEKMTDKKIKKFRRKLKNARVTRLAAKKKYEELKKEYEQEKRSADIHIHLINSRQNENTELKAFLVSHGLLSEFEST